MNAEMRLDKLEATVAALTAELDASSRKLQYLSDRSAILDCVAQHARGCDRFDVDALAGAYHPDGVDEHGFAINPGSHYPQWANDQHARGSQQCMHNITTHSCEIEGDVAHAESYVIGLFLNPDGKSARLLAGRYADRLERTDGQWRIALRRSTVDVAFVADSSFLMSESFAKLGYVKGMRDRRDVSYQRPLTLDETLSARW